MSSTSTTIPYRAGDRMGLRSLGLILRDQWARHEKRETQRYEKQLKRGEKIPMEIDGTPLVLPGPYPYDDDLDEVLFECVALSMKVVRSYHARKVLLAQAANKFAKRDDALEARAEMESIDQRTEDLRRELLRASLVRFVGLDFDGPAPDDAVDAIEDAGLAAPLIEGILQLHELTGAAKKNCGLSPGPTSPPSTATPAAAGSASPDDAPGPSRELPTTPAPSGNTTSAPAESPSTTLGSGAPSS